MKLKKNKNIAHFILTNYKSINTLKASDYSIAADQKALNFLCVSFNR